MSARAVTVLAATAFLAAPCFCQTETTVENPAKAPEQKDKRLFWIVPNYRTYAALTTYAPLTSKEKFKMATDDSFDRGTVVLAALFAGKAQLSNSDPTFGQGTKGYAHYLGTAYADLVIGDYLTEGIYPAVFHQDPRYFRRGTGSGWSRLGYAMGQIFWTHADSGHMQFNVSEVLGNATAVAISTAYYPQGRNASDAVGKFGTQIGVDMVGNIMKEFWPDVRRKFSSSHTAAESSQPATDR